MTDSTCNFPIVHGELLRLFKEVRNSPANTAALLVRARLQALRNQLIACADEATTSAYENYLSHYARRFSDPSIRYALTLADPQEHEAALEKDPSRYDHLLGLARCYLAHGRCHDARRILQKIASSRFSEAKEAQSLLELSLDEYLK